MFNSARAEQFRIYNETRRRLVATPEALIELERFFAVKLDNLIRSNLSAIRDDYNEASKLYPFWQKYPPLERGRAPKRDQFPWIEVGEHAVGAKLARILEHDGFEIRDVGLPTGADQRFLLGSAEIETITRGLTRFAWLFVDIKSVGPRDDFDHTVLSHNQVSGSGEWLDISGGVSNRIMKAVGLRTSHAFHCTMPPLFVLSSGLIAPTVLTAVKPVYEMLSLANPSGDGGQPLGRIDVITIPNGLLLEENPRYLIQYPGLFFPGKDDKNKDPLKMRARISFTMLRSINAWRYQTIPVVKGNDGPTLSDAENPPLT